MSELSPLISVKIYMLAFFNTTLIVYCVNLNASRLKVVSNVNFRAHSQTLYTQLKMRDVDNNTILECTLIPDLYTFFVVRVTEKSSGTIFVGNFMGNIFGRMIFLEIRMSGVVAKM